MSELLDFIGGQISSDQLSGLSQTIGASPEQTQQAIGAAMPTLLGALARNASAPEGESNLHQALARDHDGSIFDSLGDLLGSAQSSSPLSPKTTDGGGILDHILGTKRDRVESGVSRASGLSGSQSMKLLSMLAPILMGAIGKRQKQDQLSPGGLGELLRGESKGVEQQEGGSLLGKMFDQDGDGDFDMMDVMKFGMGRLFGGR